MKQAQGITISIHALREEGDRTIKEPVLAAWIFLSTPSARRATRLRGTDRLRQDISIHALREEGDGGDVILNQRRTISIHALREEGDGMPAHKGPGQK